MTLHEQHIAIVGRAAEYADFEGLAPGTGLRILAPREVYHPHKWSSTRFLMTALPDVAGLDVLEIGGGSGALSLAIKQRGANRVVATDISEKACAAMECNALLNNLDIDVRHGDMFAPLQDREQFDLVIFNLPLLNKPVANQAEVALCDPDGELLNRFLRGLPAVTKPEGMALFTHANISAPLPLCIPGRIGTVTEMRRCGCEVFRVLWWRL
ncbi:methyltransferase [Acidithiobacillus ferrivorans]|nr:methyltransferase [Acidithiobacillus ferrivorans]